MWKVDGAGRGQIETGRDKPAVSGPPLQKLGLVGWPVEHSVSPAIHNAAFQFLGLPWHYGLLPTPPDRLQAALDGLRTGRYRGANVTVPHKEPVVAFLDEVDDAVGAIGAANTIVVQDARLLGYNTDARGFLAALTGAGFEPAGRQALVLGAGGAARAVAYALAGAGCRVVLHNRTAARAERVAAELSALGLRASVTCLGAKGISPANASLDSRLRGNDETGRHPRESGGPVERILGRPLSRLNGLDRTQSVRGLRTHAPRGYEDVALDELNLLVNATAVGMWPEIDASPWPEETPMPSHWTVFDLVSNPEETRLLRQARAAGAKPVGGLEMLVQQAASSFKLWTGRAAPIDVMRRAAQEALRTKG